MKILVGMSGGVDSSYVAMKLIGAGHEVVGAHLVMHEYADIEAARSAAEMLGVELAIIDCRDRFDKIVRENFISEYKNGRTPNPCVICNPTVKFFALAEYARENGFDRIATGHYARVVKDEKFDTPRHFIEVARDITKDQSYMLYRLPEDILSLLMLPLGEELKSDIREMVQGSEFSSLDRRDSQEICFLPDGGYAEYIEAVSGECPRGSFIDAEGRVLGQHKGIIRYTVGQRKGLGISLGERAFVTEIDPIDNTVKLESSPRLAREVNIEDIVLALPDAPESCSGRYEVKIRYAAKPAPATVTFSARSASILFDEPQKSVTPGQSAVIYEQGRVIGGGIIYR